MLTRGKTSAGRSTEQVELSMSNKVTKTDNEWKQELTPEQYRVLREEGTERAFTGEYDKSKVDGTYRCAGCGTETSARTRSSTPAPAGRASTRRRTPTVRTERIVVVQQDDEVEQGQRPGHYQLLLAVHR